MYDIVFLGRVIPPKLKDEVAKNIKNTLNASAEILQWKLIEGIDSINDSPIKILSYLPVQSFPKNYAKWYIKRYRFSHNPKADDISLPFLNLPYIKRACMAKPAINELKSWANNGDSRHKIVILYSLMPEFLTALAKAKKINPSIKACLIADDLPSYSILEDKISLTSRLYLKWLKKNTYNKLRLIDCFVLLTKQMSDKLVLNGQKYIVMEAISEEMPQIANLLKKDNNIKKIFYAGKLNNNFGVGHLLKTFSLISDPNCRLIIYGSGDFEKSIQESAKKDSRILFRGLKERDKVLAEMLSSDIIINPRLNNAEFTKYSFPSKNMEALSTGIPFIGYKLDGIGDEYDNYINYPQDDCPESLAALILKVLQDEGGQYINKAQKAKIDMLTKKDKYTQAKRIIQMIQTIRE